MQVIIDLATAPEHVVSWVVSQMNDTQETPAQETPAQETPARKNCDLVVEDNGVQLPTKSELLTAGKAFLAANSVEELKKVLSELGIPAVSKCPEDKMAELLSKLAVG